MLMKNTVLFCLFVSLLMSSTVFGSGFTSLKGAQFELGGELEFEFVRTQSSSSVSEPNPHFKIDQLYLFPKVTVSERLLLQGDISFGSSKTIIEEMWVQYKGLPYDVVVEAGLNDMFIANIDRKTESEILVETALYRDDDMGLTFSGSSKDVYWKVSLTNGLTLASKAINEDNSYSIIHADRNTSNGNESPMLGVAVGYKSKLFQHASLDLMPFYYQGRLSTADVTYLQLVTGYGSSSDDTTMRTGINARFDSGKYTVIGQVISAEDGTLTRSGWFIQPSYKMTLSESDEFNMIEWVYRYGALTNNLSNTVSDSLTWDRSRHVFAGILSVTKGCKLKTEYYVNLEETGGSSVNNDELLVQLEIKF